MHFQVSHSYIIQSIDIYKYKLAFRKQVESGKPPLRRALNFMHLEDGVPEEEPWRVMPPAKNPRRADDVVAGLRSDMRVVPPQSATCTHDGEP